MAVAVNPIEGVLRRWLTPHVGQKRTEVLAPSVTDRDPSAAIVLESRLLRVIAASPHTHPRVVLRASLPVRLTVGCRSRGDVFSAETAATALFPYQSCSGNSDHDTAIAAALPVDIAVFSRCVGAASHEQSTKPSTSQVLVFMRQSPSSTGLRTRIGPSFPYHAREGAEVFPTNGAHAFNARWHLSIVLHEQHHGRTMTAAELRARLQRPAW